MLYYKRAARLACLTFHYGTIANLKARGVAIDENEPAEPSWWRATFKGALRWLFRTAFPPTPTPKKRGRGNVADLSDDAAPAAKKAAASAPAAASESARDESESESDDESVVDLTA